MPHFSSTGDARDISSRRMAGRLIAALVLLVAITAARSDVAHATTTFVTGSIFEQTVTVVGGSFKIQQSDSPNTPVSTSYSDPDWGSGSASSSSVVSASESGATISASISGNASPGPAAKSYGLRVYAAQGTGPSWAYSFTIDAPTVVELHGHTSGNCQQCQYSVLFGLNYGPGRTGPQLPEWTFESWAQPDSLGGGLDVGPLLLPAGSYTLSQVMVGTTTVFDQPGSFSIQLNVTLSVGGAPPPPDAVAKVVDFVGTPTVIHADGTHDPIDQGTVFHPGDVIETGSHDAVNILFVDGTTVAITESARLSIDQYINDANSQSHGFFDWLQGIFVYTSGLIGQEQPDVNIHPICGLTPGDFCPVGNIGIRGDAADFVCGNLAQTDHPCDAGVLMEDVASPVSLIAPVPAAQGPTQLSFGYAFLAPIGKLEVFLGDTLIYTTLSTDHPTNVFQHATIDLTADATTVQNSTPLAVFFDPPAQFSKRLVLVPANGGRAIRKLRFRFDGQQHGSRLLIDNIVFPGLQNGDFSHSDNGWFWEGPSRLALVATFSEARFAEFLHLLDSTAPTTTPVISSGPNANGWNKADVTVTLNAVDNSGGLGVQDVSVSLSGAQTGGGVVAGSGAAVDVLIEGMTDITYFSRDFAGNQETPHVVTVRLDETAPVISGLPANCVLWPPSSKLIQVGTVTAIDALAGLADGSLVVTGTSSEPQGTNPDIVITPSGNGVTVQFRAKRLGTGTGRVYTLTATAIDLAGNNASASTTCTVPHDQGR